MNELKDHEISIETFAEKLRTHPKLFILDVRETWEVNTVKIDHPSIVNIPMSQLMTYAPKELIESLPDLKEEFYVLCHHGIRSERITQWLRSLGWDNALSVYGGIDRYATLIDPTIGYY